MKDKGYLHGAQINSFVTAPTDGVAKNGAREATELTTGGWCTGQNIQNKGRCELKWRSVTGNAFILDVYGV